MEANTQINLLQSLHWQISVNTLDGPCGILSPAALSLTDMPMEGFVLIVFAVSPLKEKVWRLQANKCCFMTLLLITCTSVISIPPKRSRMLSREWKQEAHAARISKSYRELFGRCIFYLLCLLPSTFSFLAGWSTLHSGWPMVPPHSYISWCLPSAQTLSLFCISFSIFNIAAA